MTFQLVGQCLDQLCYRMPQIKDYKLQKAEIENFGFFIWSHPLPVDSHVSTLVFAYKGPFFYMTTINWQFLQPCLYYKCSPLSPPSTEAAK